MSNYEKARARIKSLENKKKSLAQEVAKETHDRTWASYYRFPIFSRGFLVALRYDERCTNQNSNEAERRRVSLEVSLILWLGE